MLSAVSNMEPQADPWVFQADKARAYELLRLPAPNDSDALQLFEKMKAGVYERLEKATPPPGVFP